MRAPFVSASLGADEAGYLRIGSQWTHAGTSLYGNYWVDRPPLLVTIFRLAALMGGGAPLRWLGSAACVVIVLGCAWIAHRVAGRTAAAVASVLAALLCVNSAIGAIGINGELLAAPFTVVGVAATVYALGSGREAPRLRWSLAASVLAGMALMAAILVKQNMFDVGVIAVVAVVVARSRREIDSRRTWLILGGGLAGALIGLAVGCAWTLWHGTSLTGVWNAMYPFRFEALAGKHGSKANGRMSSMLVGSAYDGLGLLLLVVLAAVVRRRVRDSVTVALVVDLAYVVLSICLGGNFWPHYQVELIVPLAVLVAVVAVRSGKVVVIALVAVALVTIGIWTQDVRQPHVTAEARIGHAIAQVSKPGDTIVTAWGQADVTEASGLPSPYPYLWYLPTRILDPGSHRLAAVLSGAQAPTWFVQWTPSVRTSSRRMEQAISQHYRPVLKVHGHVVYLHDGLSRTPPARPGSAPDGGTT